MKMTDDEVFAVLDRTERLIDCSGAFGLSEYQCEQRTVDARRKLREVRDYLSARLEADQQKGGGEVVYQVKLNGPIDAWVDTTESQFALAEDHEKRRRKLYTTPQPSIPAPAQHAPAFQRWSMTKGSDGARWSVYMDHDPCGEWVKWIEVQQHCFGIALAQQNGKASGGEIDDAVIERACIAYYELPAWTFMSHKAACKDRMRAALIAALAHSPHADQETQG